MTISQGISPIMVLVYMFACGLHKQTWGGWSWEALEDWWPFVKLAIPGFFMIGLEWWSYEIGGFVLGTINKTQQAIHLNLLNINAILFLVSLSYSFEILNPYYLWAILFNEHQGWRETAENQIPINNNKFLGRINKFPCR